MASTHNQTLSLLQKLKHKKFNSQIDPNAQSFYQNGKGNLDHIKNEFVCSYHPTETITNFCISQGQDRPKSLCPRCLQQHIKSHQQRSTICKLQTSQTQLNRISILLTQRLTKCQSLSQKITGINDWKTQSIEEMKSQLKKYKKQVIELIQNLFSNLETQLMRKYQQQNTTYQQSTRVLQISIPDLRQTCNRSLQYLYQKKDLNHILLGLPQLTQKYQTLINTEKRMIDNCSLNPQLRFNRSKLTQAMNNIQNSLQYKFNKINQYELEKKLQSIIKLKEKLKNQNINKNEEKDKDKQLKKLQKALGYNNNSSSGKLHTIDKFKQFPQRQRQQLVYQKQLFSSTVPSSPRLSKTYQSTNTKLQTSNKDNMLQKLNNTTNRLKSSLNGFYKPNKNDVYQ